MQKFDIADFAKVKHGRITILKEIAPEYGARFLQCKCDCGKVWNVALKYIKSGKIKSCGCYREELKRMPKKHGMGGRYNKATEYKIWASMIQRCTNPNDEAYTNYGGRGISVCERWRHFENFLQDMGNRPSKEYTLERKQVNGNYEPSNCKWATDIEQANNKRTTKRFNFNGKSLTVKEWSVETGINLSTLKNRLKNPNWPIEKALTHSILYK